MKLLLRPISILKGLHWVSWCVLLVVGLGLLLIMVPGEEFPVVRGQPLSDTWDANSLSLFTITQSNVDEPLKGRGPFFRTPFEHGWPARYLVRSIERCDLRLGIAGNPPPSTIETMDSVFGCRSIPAERGVVEQPGQLAFRVKRVVVLPCCTAGRYYRRSDHPRMHWRLCRMAGSLRKQGDSVSSL